jgi:hypothetical protein
MKTTKRGPAERVAKQKQHDDPGTKFRTYRITDALRQAVIALRQATNTTNKAIVEAAVTEKLPVVLQGLAALGLTGKPNEVKRPARWQIGEGTLGALKVASAQAGLPAAMLLLASLSLLCADAPRKTRKGAKS